MSNDGGVTPSEATSEVALSGVTLVSGKGALGTRRFGVPRRIRTQSRKKCGLGHGTKGQVNRGCGAADEPAYAFQTLREGLC